MKPEKKIASRKKAASNTGEVTAQTRTVRSRVGHVARAGAGETSEPSDVLKGAVKSDDQPPGSSAAPARPPVRKPARKVPPLLLEGDQPVAPTMSGPGQRYALGPAPAPEHAGAEEESRELPEAYGT